MNYPNIEQIHDGSTSIETYLKIGKEFFNYFVNLGRLKPTEDVLDIGCCIGRMAVPLLDYMTTGKYVGFDIVKGGIDWCTANITPQYPNFKFEHANIYSVLYNPTSSVKVEDYIFPYDDGSFDFIFLTSVFTHMNGYQVSNYIKEIERVLRKNGRIFIHRKFK